MKLDNRKKQRLNIIAVVGFILLVSWAQITWNPFFTRLANVCAIYVIAAVSINLINGYSGQFSLGHAGFMAIGAYASALLYMSPELKEVNYFITPIIWPLSVIQIPFFPAWIIGGLVAALAGFIIGIPCLRVRGDYLAIVTYGFSEIIRFLICNFQSITNGPLGFKGVPQYTNLWWSWGFALFTVIFIKRLIDSSYGRALRAISGDEVSAEAMGINLFKHKMLAFVLGAFFAGIAGALLPSLLMAIDPYYFQIILTYQFIAIIIMGGLGNITGSVIVGSAFAISLELLRVLETPHVLFTLSIPGIPGMRMLVISILILAVILFRHRGLFGQEISWEWLFSLFSRFSQKLRFRHK
ncbi:hypothetical protein ES706_03913 [subsurface metagenome]